MKHVLFCHGETVKQNSYNLSYFTVVLLKRPLFPKKRILDVERGNFGVNPLKQRGREGIMLKRSKCHIKHHNTKAID